jgi:hypothetical protein
MNETLRWFVPDKEDLEDERNRANRLIEETAAIEARQSSWHELCLWNATLYTNRELPGFRWGEIVADRELWPVNLRTENLIEEIGEAMMSKASSSPLKPSLVPHGMSWKTERAVRLADNFVFGVWRQTKCEEAAIMMFLDAFISGMGCVRVDYDRKNKQLSVNSVFFDNVVIDNRECVHRGMPRTYRVRSVLPKATVESRWDVKLEDKIAQYVDYRSVGEGWVVVVEAWRMPDDSGNEGHHAIVCNGQILFEEKWEHDWVPLVFFRWSDVPSGWFNKSGVEQLVPFQNRQNDLNDAIELSQDLVCRPRLLLNANSMIDINQWDNEAGRFLLYSGSKPEPFEWRTNLNDLYHERERNSKQAYSHVGMSEMFANADVPQGVRLDSSAGVREFRNMEDSRHLRLWTRFEHARLEIAQKLIKVLSISPGAKAYTTFYRTNARSNARQIPFEAIKTLADDEYSWTMDATPLSQMSPAARRELLRDWTSRGLIDPDSSEARRMEGNPNLERDEELEMAADDDIGRHISLLEDGEYEAPSRMTNCTLGIKRITASYHRLKLFEDVEEMVLQNHIKWVLQAVTIQQMATAPAGPTPFAPSQQAAGTAAPMQPQPA